MSILTVFLLILGYFLLLAGIKCMETGSISLLRVKPTSDAEERICTWLVTSIFPFVITGIAGGIAGLGSMMFSAALAAGVLQLLLIFGMLGISRPYHMAGNALRDLVLLLVCVVLLILFTSYTWSKGHPATVIGRGAGIFLLVLAVIFALWTLPFFAGRSKTMSRSAAFNTVPSAVLLVGGIALCGLGSVLFVNNTAKLAQELHIGQSLFGFAIIGLGLSLPEYVRTGRRLQKGNRPVAVRRIIATGNLGLLAMVGLTALISPISVSWGGAVLLLLSLAALAVYFVAFWHGREVGRIKGAVLLAAYVAAFIVFMQFNVL